MKRRPFKKNHKKARFLIRYTPSSIPVHWKDIAIVTIEIENMEETWTSVWWKINTELINNDIPPYRLHKRIAVPKNARATAFGELKKIKDAEERKRMAKEHKLEKKKRNASRKKRVKAMLKKRRTR